MSGPNTGVVLVVLAVLHAVSGAARGMTINITGVTP
jgi:hypothetical protein